MPPPFRSTDLVMSTIKEQQFDYSDFDDVEDDDPSDVLSDTSKSKKDRNVVP